MKRYIYLVFVGLATFIFASCEGPIGPPGADGLDGTDGEDMTSSTCLACHAGTVMEKIEGEFYSSQHALGDIAVDYAGGRSYCAECHSHQGFVEFHTFGSIAEDYAAPEAWQCGTCHGLHESMDSTDYAFRAGGAVTLEDGTVLDEGNNNTCLNCHKSRRGDGYYDDATAAFTEDETYVDDGEEDEYTDTKAAALAGEIEWGPAGGIAYDNLVDTIIITFDVPTTHVYISSTHAGPHHGDQGNVWAGVGAAGSVTESAFAAHAGGCVACHMGPESGHSFKPEGGNCNVTGCHSAVPEAAMDAIAVRLEAIAIELDAIHAVHIDGTWVSGDPLFGAVHPVLASVTRAEFQAFWNFMTVMEDRSLSAHNPTYVKALLDQCESALGI